MKKLGKILAPVLGLGLLAGSLVAINVKGAKVEKAEATDPETYIPVNKTDFFQEGWNDAWGYVRTNVNETYWNEGYSYQAMDAFFDGCGWGAEADIREGWKGTLTLENGLKQLDTFTTHMDVLRILTLIERTTL